MRALEEFMRVVKPGGWVVFGDEQFSADWKKRTDWRAQALRYMNRGFECPPIAIPASLACISSYEVFGGIAYLKVCRVPG